MSKQRKKEKAKERNSRLKKIASPFDSRGRLSLTTNTQIVVGYSGSVEDQIREIKEDVYEP